MKKIAVIYIILIIVGIIYSYSLSNTQTTAMPVDDKNIIIDAGHGGYDPGKVATDGTEEKDINLSIAEILAGYMRQGGANVTLTRISDEALSGDKKKDLKQRAQFAKSEDTDIFISIHQNSFPQEDVHGAQVFYKKDSEAGKSLAIAIQKRLAEVADVGNTRVPKADGSYYILKNSTIPSVIVECGFLSNDEEKEKLLDEEYRKHIAWAIYMGVLDYCGEGNV